MPHMYAKTINSRLAAAAGIGLLAATFGLSGCGTPTAGSAAVVGDQRISESELNSEVEAVLALQGLPATDSSNELITSTLDEMITAILVEELASREKVEVTQGEIDDLRLQYIAQAGGQEAFEDQIGGQGIAFSEVDSIIQNCDSKGNSNFSGHSARVTGHESSADLSRHHDQGSEQYFARAKTDFGFEYRCI